MPESYSTPSLFDQDGHVDHTGASDSSAAPEVGVPTNPSIAERTGWDPNDPDHGRGIEIIEPKSPQEHIAFMRAELAAHKPEDTRAPKPDIGPDFDSTVFDVDHPEWPIPNRPSR